MAPEAVEDSSFPEAFELLAALGVFRFPNLDFNFPVTELIAETAPPAITPPRSDVRIPPAGDDSVDGDAMFPDAAGACWVSGEVPVKICPLTA